MSRCPKVTGRSTCPIGGGAVGHSGEGLGRLKLIVRHLEVVECLDGQDVKPRAAVDEGLGDEDIADDG